MDYLDSNGLSYYDSKIKGHIDSVIENSVLPMIPKKGVVALGNNGYVTGGQVYNAIGSGGGGGTVTAEYPFSYVKVKKCKKFASCCDGNSYDSKSPSLDISKSLDELYFHSKDYNPLMESSIGSRYIIYAKDYLFGGETYDGINYKVYEGTITEFSDENAFDLYLYYPSKKGAYVYSYRGESNKTVTPFSEKVLGATYTSEGEMEIHNYCRINNYWMTYYNDEESIYLPKTYSLVAPVLRIDDKIQYIGSKAFYTHNKNITLYISAVEPPVIQSDTFYGFNAIHVPSGSLDLYKSANNWSAYGDFMIGDL